jgi:SNF2 family DNA or RNA helicase
MKTELKKHQLKAVEKLSKIKIGALYMEQGTGKTRTALELIKNRLESNKVEKVLWLCPCSIKSEIKNELHKHIDIENDFSNTIFIFGIESLSSSIKLNCLLLRLVKEYKVYLIVDESNLIKNHQALRTKNIQRLSEKCSYKLILNGTPVSRNEADLYSQWYLLDWRILGYKSFWSFEQNHMEYNEYGRIVNVLNVDYLSKKIAPYSYTIKKSECMNLPKKIYEECRYALTEHQQMHYIDIKDAFLMQIDEAQPETIYRFFTALQHVTAGNQIISHYEDRIKAVPFFKNVYDNPRIKKFLNILPDEKTIIWCKYTREIKEIEKILIDNYGADKVTTFYGEIRQKNRRKNIEKFRDKAKYFIANKTCAGYGLNMQFCNNVIYYNNDFDLATRLQSEDRVHRMGQENEVYIKDIIAYETIDQVIINCLYRKENLVESFKRMINKYKKEVKKNG